MATLLCSSQFPYKEKYIHTLVSPSADVSKTYCLLFAFLFVRLFTVNVRITSQEPRIK